MTAFETEVCGRCGGSGKHSYNQMHGTMCYGCSGKGIRLTKRGEIASAKYLELCSVKAYDLKVGDVCRLPAGLGGTVKAAIAEISEERVMGTSITRDASGEIASETPWYGFDLKYKVGKEMHGYGCGKETVIRKFWPKDQNDQFVAQTIELQNSLTKAGKPMKRAA